MITSSLVYFSRHFWQCAVSTGSWRIAIGLSRIALPRPNIPLRHVCRRQTRKLYIDCTSKVRSSTMATPNIGQTPQSVTSNIFVISQSNCIRISTGTLVNTVNIIISFFCVKSSILGGRKLPSCHACRIMPRRSFNLKPATCEFAHVAS